ncbi:MAG: transcriptional regulator [Clostridiales bacterium GWB2_37_7]|nr:MAG: transcriptional regulator [Clostridiales bacterium GWB2_37_7]
MITKGNKTRQFIIENSINLFSEKGYTAVTMKDICEKCQMSRGGVYRYFSSTKEIFSEMLDADLELNRLVVEERIQEKVPAERIIDAYFRQEIESIYSNNNGLYFAIHEFAFAEPDQRESLNQRVNDSVNILETIFAYGQETHEFKMFDREAVAIHIIYFMDSLKTSSSILTMSKDMLTKQINLLKELII